MVGGYAYPELERGTSGASTGARTLLLDLDLSRPDFEDDLPRRERSSTFSVDILGSRGEAMASLGHFTAGSGMGKRIAAA